MISSPLPLPGQTPAARIHRIGTNALTFFLCLLFSLAGLQGRERSGMKRHEFTGEPLKGLRVALDIGHNTKSHGATSARGRGELYFNLDTTRVIARVLKQAGAEPILINEDGKIQGLAERATLAQKKNADCFISVHHDAVNQKYVKSWVHEGVTREYSDVFRGYSVFASEKNGQPEVGRKLALQVGEALFASGLKPTLHHAEPIQGENRPLLDKRTGVYEFTDLVVLKSATMPAILLECGVIVHREEELLVQEEWYQELVAHALVKALEGTFRNGENGKAEGGGKARGLQRLFGPKR